MSAPASLRPTSSHRSRGVPAVVALGAALLLLLGACGAPEDPQLAMCQGVAKQLTGNTVTGWERTERTDSSRSRHVAIAYRTTGDGSGSIDCLFPIDREGIVATAPDRVDLNGARVGQRELLVAGTSASRELLAGTAAKTAERTRELANEAGEKVRDVAGQAVGGAVEAGQALQEKLER